MALEVLQDHFLAVTTDVHGQDAGVESLVLEGMDQLIVIDGDHLGLFVCAVDDAGYQTRVTQAAARTFPHVTAGFRVNGQILRHRYLPLLLSNKNTPPTRDQVLAGHLRGSGQSAAEPPVVSPRTAN